MASADPTSAEGPGPDDGNELERLRLENETLSGVVGVVTSGPDLAHILDRVVDLLTRATDSHACFVYLRAEGRLVMRAASPVYSHLIGKIAFGIDEGLAGWAMRRGEAAFIREGAVDDPRTVYVPELDEERFQSMVAVPIPSRADEALGVIVLHTVAPREFDERIINVLSRAASLIAGAIENARLYEEAQERVGALTQLSTLGREIAGVADRDSLFRVAAEGVRKLLGGAVCRVYEDEGGGGELKRVASSPPAGAADSEGEASLVIELLEAGGALGESARDDLATRLGLDASPPAALAVPLTADGKLIGALLALAWEPWPPSGPELLRAAAQQLALAIQRTHLIERLTAENLARDLFDALAAGELSIAAEKATAAGLELSRPHLVLEARSRGDGAADPWSERATEVERAIKHVLPTAFCDPTSNSVRALAPLGDASAEAVHDLGKRLNESASALGLAIGLSEGQQGIEGTARGLGEAADATTIAVLLEDGEPVLPYRDTGAYRYLIDILDEGGPRDHLRDAVDRIAAYDEERRAQLLVTLDEYLSQGRSVAATARALFIHANTLRQRLERIETLTGLRVADEDLLALQLAVKLGRVRRT